VQPPTGLCNLTHPAPRERPMIMKDLVLPAVPDSSPIIEILHRSALVLAWPLDMGGSWAGRGGGDTRGGIVETGRS